MVLNIQRLSSYLIDKSIKKKWISFCFTFFCLDFGFRLSSVAGERLRFNNPAIADLSDENRPNKLAEKFSELYDNEWTEFYENMEGTGTEDKVDI